MTCGQWSNISRWPCVILYNRYLKPGHLNVNLSNIAISCHSLHLESLHHNPHYHQHQHQGDLTLGWSLNFFSDVNRDLLRSFIVNKDCRFLCYFFYMFNAKPTQRLKLRNFSVDKQSKRLSSKVFCLAQVQLSTRKSICVHHVSKMFPCRLKKLKPSLLLFFFSFHWRTKTNQLN